MGKNVEGEVVPVTVEQGTGHCMFSNAEVPLAVSTMASSSRPVRCSAACCESAAGITAKLNASVQRNPNPGQCAVFCWAPK